MKVLYCKHSNNRKREFQIKTRIVDVDGVKQIWKEPIDKKGVNHIRNMHKNQQLLESLYGSRCSQYELIGNKIVTEYFEYECTLSDKILNAIKKDDEKELKNLINYLKKIIVGRDSNKCSFKITEQFKRIFGEVDLKKADAVMVANLDLQPDNILFNKDGDVRVIDYEWVFNFPVTIEFILYYSIRGFVTNYLDIKKIDEICELAGIQKSEISKYEEMITSFFYYISFDDSTNIEYGKMGAILQNEIDLEGYLKRLRYGMPDFPIEKGKNVVVYGAGKVGMDFIAYLKATAEYNIVCWVDKRGNDLNNLEVEGIERLLEIKTHYDGIIIAVLKEKMANEIKTELINAGIDEKKIFWKKPE